MSRTLARPASLALGAALLAVACTPSMDCRYAQWACAPGFQCVQEEGGAWECRPLASTVQPPAVAVPPSLAAMPDRLPPAPAAGPRDCTGRPPCGKDALECTCDEHGRLLTTVFDTDKDGKRDECARYTYPGPAIKVIEVDQRCDGGVDLVHRQQVDGQGDLVVWDTEQNTAPEKNLFRRFRYESGKLVATETALGKPENLIQRCDYQPPCPPPIPNPQCKPVCENLDKKLPGQ